MEVINFTVKRGETFNGFVLTVSDSLSQPIDLTDSLVNMDVKSSACATTSELSFSTGNNTIAILDGVNGVLAVLPVVIDISPKSLYYDLKIVLADTTTIYPIGGNFIVSNNITR